MFHTEFSSCLEKRVPKNNYHFSPDLVALGERPVKPKIANMRNWGGEDRAPPQSKKSGERIYIWSSKLKIGGKIVQELSGRLPVTFF